MIQVQFIGDISQEPLSAEQSYDRLTRLADKLAPELSAGLRWWGGMNNPSDNMLPLDHREQFLTRLKEGDIRPGEGVRIIVTSSPRTSGPVEPGTFMIWFDPFVGSTSIEVDYPNRAFGTGTYDLCKRVFVAMVATEPVTFAYANVMAKAPDRKFPVSYRADFATFPHRKCLGWMGFVPQVVTAEQLPLAAELVPVPGKGTVIVAVNEPFDLNNMQHIQRANQIEMDMVDHDLLPVTDPSFL